MGTVKKTTKDKYNKEIDAAVKAVRDGQSISNDEVMKEIENLFSSDELIKELIKEIKNLKKAIKLIKDAFPEDVLEDQLGEDILKWDKLTKNV